jgi:hypothetical protein
MTDQTFRWLDADGNEIMRGSLSALAEHLPDTPARDAALEEAVQAAVQAVEAEQRRDQARASTAQMISDAVERLMARVDREEQYRADQERIKAEQAAQAEQEEIQRTLDALPDPDSPDPLGAASDDGDLEIKHEVEAERYGSQVEEDAEQVKPVLSYGNTPMSYIKKKDATADLPEDLEMRSPAPLGTDPVYDPAELAHPQDPKRQIPQPIAPSLW